MAHAFPLRASDRADYARRHWVVEEPHGQGDVGDKDVGFAGELNLRAGVSKWIDCLPRIVGRGLGMGLKANGVESRAKRALLELELGKLLIDRPEWGFLPFPHTSLASIL